MKVLLPVLFVLALVAGCGDGEPNYVQPVAAPTPPCSEVWVAGNDLPTGYAGCEETDGKVTPSLSYDCADGTALVSYQQDFWAVGGKVVKGDREGYGKALDACQKVSADAAEAALRPAVQAFSDALVTGDAAAAYAYLSARCQQKIPAKTFAGTVAKATAKHGKALPIKTYQAQVTGLKASVSYTFSAADLAQQGEPWVRENGSWNRDRC